MRQYRVTLEGRTFDVRLLSDPRQAVVEVEVDGVPLTVEVEEVKDQEEGLPVEDTGAGVPARRPASAGVKRLTAPLPGTIKSIDVQVGEAVARGQKLLVIEAMKMDNVIGSPRDGVIEAIHATLGQQVAHGEPLLDFRS